MPVVAAVVVLLALVVGGARPAAASCAGPHVVVPATADRGATLTLAGESFGSGQCYDTGPPPPGQGALGPPATDIEVRLVQGEREVVVAEGDAGDDYRFQVDVVVPPDFVPGPAEVHVHPLRWPDPAAYPLTITEAAPAGGAVVGVVDFSVDRELPAAADDVDPAAAEGDYDGDDGGGIGPLWVAALLVAIVAVRLVIVRRAVR